MYHKGSEPRLRRALEQGVRKVTDGLASCAWNMMEPAEWKGFDSDGLLFKNMNPPADYEEAQAKFGRRAETMSEHYFEFRNVSKSFGDNAVLKDVSFFVDQGETAVIMGRSGVGKSVSLKLLLGFLQPDEGQIIVAGQDVTEWTEEQFSKFGGAVTMVFQSGALFDSLTVAENVAFPLESARRNRRAGKSGRESGGIDEGAGSHRFCRSISFGFEHGQRSARWRSRALWPKIRKRFCTTSRPPWWIR